MNWLDGILMHIKLSIDLKHETMAHLKLIDKIAKQSVNLRNQEDILKYKQLDGERERHLQMLTTWREELDSFYKELELLRERNSSLRRNARLAKKLEREEKLKTDSLEFSFEEKEVLTNKIEPLA